MGRENKKVILGMSGGTDSSVAAILLQDKGYEITGVTFRFFDKESTETDIKDAKDVCKHLSLPHRVYDARDRFKTEIVDYFINEYLSGRTPVPCARCNHLLKWPLLAGIADEMGAFYIATGHYANIIRDNEGDYYFSCGKDAEKDQSFFLWGLPQTIMGRIILPLGNYTKQQIRAIAAEKGYSKVARKKDSIGICFCPGDYRSFITPYIPAEILDSGYFYNIQGEIIGKHKGYPFYTIGQRRGLGINFHKPVFVKEINTKTNSIFLDGLCGLYKSRITIIHFNLVNESKVLNSQSVICRIRYRKQATPAKVSKINEKELLINLLEPLESIAPGQSAVLYIDNCVVGGGIISSSE